MILDNATARTAGTMYNIFGVSSGAGLPLVNADPARHQYSYRRPSDSLSILLTEVDPARGDRLLAGGTDVSVS